jgi:hypothetical protein
MTPHEKSSDEMRVTTKDAKKEAKRELRRMNTGAPRSRDDEKIREGNTHETLIETN